MIDDKASGTALLIARCVLLAARDPALRKLVAEGEPEICRRCGEPFASAQQITDLKDVLPQVGFDYSIAGGGNYQDTCPRCRRASLTLAQSARVGGFG